MKKILLAPFFGSKNHQNLRTNTKTREVIWQNFVRYFIAFSLDAQKNQHKSLKIFKKVLQINFTLKFSNKYDFLVLFLEFFAPSLPYLLLL